MLPGRILNATRVVGTSDQDYGKLYIEDVRYEGGIDAMRSIWEPTPGELKALQAGGKIRLVIVGVQHPAVLLEVVAQPDPLIDADEVFS